MKRVICVLVAAVVGLISVSAERVQIEAENYLAFHDTANSGMAKVPASCSGGALLAGLDSAGEWTEYEVAIEHDGLYALGVLCRGDLGTDYILLLAFSSDQGGEDQTTQLQFSGVGYG